MANISATVEKSRKKVLFCSRNMGELKDGIPIKRFGLSQKTCQRVSPNIGCPLGITTAKSSVWVCVLSKQEASTD